MSNTTRLSPYGRTEAGFDGLRVCVDIASACITGAASGISSVAQWLSEETPEEKAALERTRKARRENRVKEWQDRSQLGPKRKELGITTVNLHLRDMEPLIHSAKKLGFKTEVQAQSSTRPDQVLLRKDTGERLAIIRNAKGRVAVGMAGDQGCIQSLVRQHSFDQAVEHLKKAGMAVQTAKLSNGEIQILAREQDRSKTGGSANVKAQIHTDGTAWVDVDNITGNRCEQIVRELAGAVGVEITGTRKKDAFFQLPGEPAKTRVRVKS